MNETLQMTLSPVCPFALSLLWPCSASRSCELTASEGAADKVFQRCAGRAVLVTPVLWDSIGSEKVQAGKTWAMTHHTYRWAVGDPRSRGHSSRATMYSVQPSHNSKSSTTTMSCCCYIHSPTKGTLLGDWLQQQQSTDSEPPAWCVTPAVWPGASSYPTLCLSFSISKRKTIIHPPHWVARRTAWVCICA